MIFQPNYMQKTNKLAPYGTDGQLLAMDRPYQIQSHMTQKLGQISQIRPEQS